MQATAAKVSRPRGSSSDSLTAWAPAKMSRQNPDVLGAVEEGDDVIDLTRNQTQGEERGALERGGRRTTPMETPSALRVPGDAAQTRCSYEPCHQASDQSASKSTCIVSECVAKIHPVCQPRHNALDGAGAVCPQHWEEMVASNGVAARPSPTAGTSGPTEQKDTARRGRRTGIKQTSRPQSKSLQAKGTGGGAKKSASLQARRKGSRKRTPSKKAEEGKKQAYIALPTGYGQADMQRALDWTEADDGCSWRCWVPGRYTGGARHGCVYIYPGTNTRCNKGVHPACMQHIADLGDEEVCPLHWAIVMTENEAEVSEEEDGEAYPFATSKQ